MTYQLVHRFTPDTPFGGWRDQGFEPSRIIQLGVKFAIGDGSGIAY